MARVDQIRRIPIRESLTTRMLILGCEPFSLILVFLFALFPLPVVLLFRELPFIFIVFEIFLIIFGIGIAKFISREDGYMLAILMRHAQYQTYYLAHEGYPGKDKLVKTIETKTILS